MIMAKPPKYGVNAINAQTTDLLGMASFTATIGVFSDHGWWGSRLSTHALLRSLAAIRQQFARLSASTALGEVGRRDERVLLSELRRSNFHGHGGIAL
jgi:hypothetical protein